METFNASTFAAHGLPVEFAQDTHSYSKRGVVRGQHYQLEQPQGKLVRCTRGTILDVAVDIRRGSPTFGKWVGETLSAANRKQIFVPIGFAHGFLVLSDTAEVIYKASDFYAPAEERGILWNDPAVGIRWPDPGVAPVINARDAGYPALAAAKAEDLPEHRS